MSLSSSQGFGLRSVGYNALSVMDLAVIFLIWLYFGANTGICYIGVRVLRVWDLLSLTEYPMIVCRARQWARCFTAVQNRREFCALPLSVVSNSVWAMWCLPESNCSCWFKSSPTTFCRESGECTECVVLGNGVARCRFLLGNFSWQ